MSEFALKQIRVAKEKRLTKLDLHSCRLSKWPKQLFELTWLEELLLSDSENDTYEYDDNYNLVKTIQDDRPWRENTFGFIHFKIGKLKNLKKLSINGHWENI